MCRFIIFLIPQFIDRCNAWVIFILLHYEKLHKEMVNWLVLVCQKSNTNQAWKVKKCNIAHQNWMWSCTVLVMFARFLHVNTEPNAGRYLREHTSGRLCLHETAFAWELWRIQVGIGSFNLILPCMLYKTKEIYVQKDGRHTFTWCESPGKVVLSFHESNMAIRAACWLVLSHHLYLKFTEENAAASPTWDGRHWLMYFGPIANDIHKLILIELKKKSKKTESYMVACMVKSAVLLMSYSHTWQSVA